MHIRDPNGPFVLVGDVVDVQYCKNGVQRYIPLHFCPFCGVQIYTPEEPLTNDELAPAEAILKGVQSLDDVYRVLGVPDRQFDRKPPWVSQLDYYNLIAGVEICVLVSQEEKLEFLLSRGYSNDAT